MLDETNLMAEKKDWLSKIDSKRAISSLNALSLIGQTARDIMAITR